MVPAGIQRDRFEAFTKLSGRVLFPLEDRSGRRLPEGSVGPPILPRALRRLRINCGREYQISASTWRF